MHSKLTADRSFGDVVNSSHANRMCKSPCSTPSSGIHYQMKFKRKKTKIFLRKMKIEIITVSKIPCFMISLKSIEALCI